MNKVLAIIVGILIIGGIGWFVISNQNVPEESSPQAQSERVPDFALQNYDGKTVRLADFVGKPLVINSWAAWCPFCRKELVDFAAAQKEFGNNVAIIAVDRAESRETAKKYTDELGLTNNMIFLLDPSDSFYQSIGGFSMPETVFVDGAGVTQFHKRGPMDVNEIRERVQMLLDTSGQNEKSSLPVSSSNKELESQENVVNYTGTQFNPQSLRVKSGTTIIFRNESGKSLWVASDAHPIHTDYPGFDSLKNVEAEETYPFTFTKTGAWGYHNHLNPSQGGKIIVE